MLQQCLKVPQCICEVYIHVYIFAEIMYEAPLAPPDPPMYVQYVHDLPSNQQQLTHVWKPSTTFTNLTIKEFHASVERAQEINQLLTTRQARDEAPMLNALAEQESLKVSDTEIPQVSGDYPDLETIAELLQDELMS